MPARTFPQAARHALPVLLLAASALACAPADDHTHDGSDHAPDAGAPAGPKYEVWTLDQGLNRVHVFDETLTQVGFIQYPDTDGVPHMIDFTDDYEYAFVAHTAGAKTSVIRTSDRQVIARLDTGAGSHMARVTRGKNQVLVDVIGTGTIQEVTFDLEKEEFTLGRSLKIADDETFAQRAELFGGSKPVCHELSADGKKAYVTLGPAWTEAGLVILDTETFKLTKVFPPNEVQANCGTIRSPDGTKVFVNGGSPVEGKWWVLQASDDTVVHTASSGGSDAHGVFLTPDGAHLWMVNRASSDGIVIDPETYEVKHTLADIGKSPDILTMSPDGKYAFITLRGPNPKSGPHTIAGTTPGIAVVDVATRTLVKTLEPNKGEEASDFHGIALRPLD